VRRGERDYNLTRVLGGTTSTLRSARRRKSGPIFGTAGLRLSMRGWSAALAMITLGTPETARLMAMMWTGKRRCGDRLFGTPSTSMDFCGR